VKLNGRRYVIKTGLLTIVGKVKEPGAYHELNLAIYLHLSLIDVMRAGLSGRGLSRQADFSETTFLLSEPLPEVLLSADLLCFSFLEGLSESFLEGLSESLGLLA
jgi:hypothetical protein